MKINLNIIKILILAVGIVTNGYAWIDYCPTCTGCQNIKDDIKDAAKDIDDAHEEMEKAIKKKYQKDILDDNIAIIDTIQEGITKSVARITAMEHQANIDSKELIFVLKQNKKLYTLPAGNL